MERQGGTKVHMAKTAQHLLSLASPSSRFKQILPVFFSGQRKTFRNHGFIAANKQNYQIACQKGRSWQPLGSTKMPFQIFVGRIFLLISDKNVVYGSQALISFGKCTSGFVAQKTSKSQI